MISFDDFNPASSIRRLWNDLGLASTDISMNINEFNRSLLQQYASGEMSGKEVFESAKGLFLYLVSKLVCLIVFSALS